MIVATADADQILAELLSPAGREDPYPYYHRLRELSPLHRGPGAWYATRYRDCAQILRDARFGKRHAPSADTAGTGSLMSADPPDHTRLRNLINPAFSPSAVRALRPRVQACADRLVADIVEAGQNDFMSAVAFPLTLFVIGEIMGVPPDHRAAFEALNRDMTLAFEAGADTKATARAEAASDTADAYFLRLATFRPSGQSGRGLFPILAEAHRRRHLTTAEFLTNAKFVFGAGFETSAYLLGNAVVALARHPEQFDRLHSSPDLLPLAVEELLRYDNSIQRQERRAMRDAEIAGTVIAAGERVVTLLGAANRDGDQFPDSDRLDVARPDTRALSFGGGVHYCPGAGLARVELESVLVALLGRVSTIELSEPSVRRPSLSIRGFLSVPLRLSLT